MYLFSTNTVIGYSFLDNIMIKSSMIGVTLIAFFAIQIVNSVFGQTSAPSTSKSCIMYDGTNLKIVGIGYYTPGKCQKELDTIIGTFHPTGITLSTQDVVLNEGGTPYREDIIYLTK